jgi:folate-binding protein YgfZ
MAVGNQQITSDAGVADLSRVRTRLRVTGEDRVSFLQGQCTNDIKRLAVGESCYAAFLNAKGKMRGEGHIICLPGEFLLEANLGLAASLEKFIITEDVSIEDVSTTMGEWLVLGEAGVNLPANAVTFRHPLGLGVLSEIPLTATVDEEMLEVIRIEAAVPKWGADMDETTIPNEAGLEASAINYEKGCYIGQETIARIKTYGHVNRRLVQIVIGSQAGTPVPPAPSHGDKIYASDRDVGQVTSAVFSSRLGKPLALGYVRREFATAGTKLMCNNEPMEVLRVCGE